MAESDDDDSKTEEPTQKKIDEAIQKGDVAKSQELSTFFVLAAATVFVAFLSKGVAGTLAHSLPPSSTTPTRSPPIRGRWKGCCCISSG
jgi:flagellar biosynthetic protein FlhB